MLLTVAARNFGTKVADGFFWEIRFPDKLSSVLSFADALWKPTGYGAEVVNDTLYWVQKDFYDKKLFVNTHTDVARILVQANRVKDLVVQWRVEGENGPGLRKAIAKSQSVLEMNCSLFGRCFNKYPHQPAEKHAHGIPRESSTSIGRCELHFTFVIDGRCFHVPSYAGLGDAF